MIRTKNETDDLLFSKTENCETPIKQTHTKPRGTLEFKLTKPRKTFSFKPPVNLGLDSTWTVGLTPLEVYKSLFDITEEITNFNFKMT